MCLYVCMHGCTVFQLQCKSRSFYDGQTTFSPYMASDYKLLQVSNTDVSHTTIRLCMFSDYKHLQVSKIEVLYTAIIPVTINARIHRLSSLILLKNDFWL